MTTTHPEKIYNDAPDEFAEFLDQEGTTTLATIGGRDNPFVKAGILRELPRPTNNCDTCEIGRLTDIDPDDADAICLKCRMSGPPTDDEIEFALNLETLGEFISSSIGCKVCRQFKRTGLQFGQLRGHDVYFACRPTASIYKALEMTPKSVLIIGQNNPKEIPSQIANRTISLSRLLYVDDGSLHVAPEVIEEKIPMPKSEAKSKTVSPKCKKPSRPPIQVYAPYYLQMIREWIMRIRKSGKLQPHTAKWISGWMLDYGPFKDHRLSERQVYRHLGMLKEMDFDTKKPDRRSPVFVVYWNGCSDMKFVQNFSDADINDIIIKTFDTAKTQGFAIRPMRKMDAAEYAEKVRV